MYIRRKTYLGHWAAGKTKSSTSASFHVRSLILAVWHRANSLFAMSSETGQPGCVSRGAEPHPHTEFDRAGTWTQTSCALGKPPAVHALPVSSLPDHKFSPNQYISSACLNLHLDAWNEMCRVGKPLTSCVCDHMTDFSGLGHWKRTWKWAVVLKWHVSVKNWTCWPCLSQGKGRTLLSIQLYPHQLGQ